MNTQEYDIVVPSETDFKLITKTWSEQLWWYQNDSLNVVEARNLNINVNTANTWVDLSINVPTDFNSNYSVLITNIGATQSCTIRILNNKVYAYATKTGQYFLQGTFVYPRQDKMP